MQPHGQRLDLEIRRGAKRRPAGAAFDDSECREDMRASLRALAELTAAGVYELRQEIRLDFEFHFLTAEDWTEWLARPRAGGLEANQELLDRTLPALVSGEATIVATEKDVAGVYERRSAGTATSRPGFPGPRLDDDGPEKRRMSPFSRPDLESRR